MEELSYKARFCVSKLVGFSESGKEDDAFNFETVETKIFDRLSEAVKFFNDMECVTKRSFDCYKHEAKELIQEFTFTDFDEIIGSESIDLFISEYEKKEIDVAGMVKAIMKEKNISLTNLAELLHTSKSNLSQKFTANNFRVSELAEIAEVLGCELEIKIK